MGRSQHYNIIQDSLIQEFASYIDLEELKGDAP
jgi:hypothetical protein